MNRLPAKQIYLLAIIIVGIIALSMYSTYAIFTYESETSDVVSIELPSTLSINEEMYEYKQLAVNPKSTNTTDIDIYNTFDYDLCYSIWYKVAGTNPSNIEILELNNEDLESSGTIIAGEAKRVTLLVINNSSKKEKINIGVSTDKKNEICNLKISNDKKIVKTNINNNLNYLSETISKNVSNPKTDSKEGYITYSSIEEPLSLNNLIVSDSFTEENEKFILSKEEEFDYTKEKDIKNYYFCPNEKCNILYRINDYNITDELINITNYDKLVPYQKGTSGVKKIDNNYYYYGDNPDNFVKFNCSTNNKCELWRIIGSFYNQNTNKYSIKLIKNENIGKHIFNSNNNLWNESNSLYSYLQKDYKINYELSNLTEEFPIRQETIDELNQIKDNNINLFSKQISLLNVSDFLNASTCDNKKIDNNDCINGNWLNNSLVVSEWTMTNYIETPKEEIKEELESDEEVAEEIKEPEEVIIKAISVGDKVEKANIEDSLSIRPVVYISDRTLIIEGNGSYDSPYVLK